MGTAQLSLQQAQQIAARFIPSGWRVRMQYQIRTDEIMVRVENEDRSKFADLLPISAIDLYLSADGLAQLLMPAIQVAVEQINLLSQPQVQADANSATT